MKAAFVYRLLASTLASVLLVSSVSCTTTYDHMGRPRQKVDAGTVVAGVLLAGLIVYALAEGGSYDDDCDDYWYDDCNRY